MRSKRTAGRLWLLQHRQPHGQTAGDYLHRHMAQAQALQKGPVGFGGEGVLVVEAHAVVDFNDRAIGRSHLSLKIGGQKEPPAWGGHPPKLPDRLTRRREQVEHVGGDNRVKAAVRAAAAALARRLVHWVRS